MAGTTPDLSHSTQGEPAPPDVNTHSVAARNGKPIRIDPDLDFIRSLNQRVGNALNKCFQCGTCSATCALSSDSLPIPRKEMAWATWGMKERLLNDPDLWLCYQCNDCSTRCPRGARPGDVLAVLRQEAIVHYAFPRFYGRWANQPHSIPLLLGIPAALLTLALFLRVPLENALGISRSLEPRISYSYSNVLPHWLLNGLFLLIALLAVLSMIGGVLRLWRSMRNACGGDGHALRAKGFLASVGAALKSVLAHDRFSKCTQSSSRYWSHLAVFFGFLALSLVTLWVITAPYNPLIQGDFIYPFGFWNPWKLLANLGGIALVGGCLWMIWDRLRDGGQAGVSTFFDWALIVALLAAVLTGFMTEILHFLRLEPHRHLAYFVHLVVVGALFLCLPYTKFAHIVYRTAALASAEYYGRNRTGPAVPVQGTTTQGTEV